jgi:predicted nucleotidyltransferase
LERNPHEEASLLQPTYNRVSAAAGRSRTGDAMPVPMTPAQLAGYRVTAERRRREESERRAERRVRAWDAARLGAAILRERFGASSVMVFGSLAGERWFGEASDVDLAASGLQADDYFTAVASLQGLLGEFEVDLVDLDRCPPGLREAVLGERVAL